MQKVTVGALIIGATIVAGAMFERYEITATYDDGAIYRVDRLTGSVEVCLWRRGYRSHLQPHWCEAWRQMDAHRAESQALQNTTLPEN